MGLNKPQGGGGVTDHNLLTNRTAVDGHPMSAITGLVADLNAKATAITNATNTANTASSTATTADGKATTADSNATTALGRIGTLASLLTTAKGDLVSAINENFTNANNGKANLATAINGKGGTANAGMTFAQLASAITAIPMPASPTGDAVAGDVRAGKTFSNAGGTGIAGTLAVRTGDNTALATSTSGTTFKLRPPAGIYDGVTDMVTHADANRVAGNIKAGVTIDGVAGSLTPKLSAQGSFNFTATSYGQMINTPISGLGFVPNIIQTEVDFSNAGSGNVQNNQPGGHYLKVNGNITTTQFQTINRISIESWTTSGFTIRYVDPNSMQMTAGTIRWRAIE